MEAPMKLMTRMGATLALVAAAPALASDVTADREAARARLQERSEAARRPAPPDRRVGRVEARPAEGRPCCVTHGRFAVDHLRG
jgi:hypothetical protein